MATWKRLPQECEGDFFSGQAYMTRGVQDALSPEEIAFDWRQLLFFLATPLHLV